MTFFGAAGLESRSAQFSGSLSRTDVLGRKYAPFANPFFDHASTYTPPSIKSLFGFCRFYFLTHGLIHAITTKASEYPITDVILQDPSEGVQNRWQELLLESMNYRVQMFETNLDYFTYGNAFTSMSFPFRKKLQCKNCTAELDAIEHRKHWRYTNHKFWLTCPKCGQSGFAPSKDVYYNKASEISLIRWNPEQVNIFYNEATGRMDYSLDLSQQFRNEIQLGRKDLVATTPSIFLDAVKQKRLLVFDKRSVFHMRRPTLSSANRGWGVPLIMPVLKDAFYMQIMKKASEAILLDRIIPQVFLFPQPATGGADPFCVSPDTLVEVPGGVLPAEEVREGSLLRSHTGEWRRVEKLVRRPVLATEPVYKITARTLPGFPFTVSAEHPVLAAKYATNSRAFDKAKVEALEFIEARRLEEGDFVGYPVHRQTRDDLTIDVSSLFPERACTDNYVYLRYDRERACIYEYFEAYGIPMFKRGPEKLKQAFLEEQGWSLDAYASVQASYGSQVQRHPRRIELDASWMKIIGYFLAEGSTTEIRTTFAFHLDEDDYVEELVDSLHRVGFTCTVDPRPEQGCQIVRCESVYLAGILRGLCGQYSQSRRIPQVCAEAPDEMLWELLRCLFNGDGCYITSDRKGTARVALKTVSPHLALEVRRILLSLGFICGVSRAQPSSTEIAKAVYYQVYCNGAHGEQLAHRFGWEPLPKTGCCQERTAFLRDGYLYMRIRSIEQVNEPEVIGFQMSGERTFCVAGVATHNTTVDLANWRSHIQREMARQRLDPAYKAIVPFPVGHQIIGGDGRSLLLQPEMRQVAEMIAVGMGFPIDLVFGQGTYAGTSVNMRMLENFFQSNVLAHYRLMHWVINQIAHFLNWPKIEGRLKPFKMADDLQRQAFAFQLNQAGKVSDTTLLSLSDFKVEDESELQVKETEHRLEAMKRQQTLLAEAQGEAGVVAAKYQAKAQEVMMESQQNAQQDMAQESAAQFERSQGSGLAGAQAGVPLDQLAGGLASQLRSMPEDVQNSNMEQLKTTQPELAELVKQKLMSAGSQPQVDMRPMPDQLPPRRDGVV